MEMDHPGSRGDGMFDPPSQQPPLGGNGGNGNGNGGHNGGHNGGNSNPLPYTPRAGDRGGAAEGSPMLSADDGMYPRQQEPDEDDVEAGDNSGGGNGWFAFGGGLGGWGGGGSGAGGASHTVARAGAAAYQRLEQIEVPEAVSAKASEVATALKDQQVRPQQRKRSGE